MSAIASHLTLNISETVTEAWFQMTTNRKWHMGYQMVNWPMTSRNPKGAGGCTVGYPSDSLASCHLLLLAVIVIKLSTVVLRHQFKLLSLFFN